MSALATTGVFTIPLKPPEVSIMSPITDDVYLPTQSFNLVGGAVDREDGSLDGDSLSWTTSVSGSLGTGRIVGVTSLPLGLHEIILTAADSDGLASTATVSVRIVPAAREAGTAYLRLVFQ
jgi:hypothetical protein